MLLPRSRYDEGVEILKATLSSVAYGDPQRPDVLMGPVVSSKQRERVLGYIAKGVEEGATLALGGKKPEHLPKGWFIEPTLFTDVDNAMTIAQEEIFGPVLATLTFEDMDEVAELANKNVYGLAAAVWTNDLKKAHQLSRRLKAGTVWINTYGLMDAALPFGGYKQSGFGRELGMHAIEHYTELKTVWMNL
jgi:aldehyde dehydrogenase (NAD+)